MENGKFQEILYLNYLVSQLKKQPSHMKFN